MKRYDIDIDTGAYPCNDGDWIKYEEAQKRVEELEKFIKGTSEYIPEDIKCQASIKSNALRSILKETGE